MDWRFGDGELDHHQQKTTQSIDLRCGREGARRMQNAECRLPRYQEGGGGLLVGPREADPYYIEPAGTSRRRVHDSDTLPDPARFPPTSCLAELVSRAPEDSGCHPPPAPPPVRREACELRGGDCSRTPSRRGRSFRIAHRTARHGRKRSPAGGM